MNDTKRCSKCGEEKPLSDFHRHKTGRDGLRSECKTCESARHKRYRETNREKIRERHKRYREANLEKHRAGVARAYARRRKVERVKLYRLHWPDGTAYIGVSVQPMRQRLAVHRRKGQACYDAFRTMGEPSVEVLADFSRDKRQEALDVEAIFIRNEARWNDKLLNTQKAAAA